MEQALYGPDGFFVHHRPAEHFRTSAHSPLFALALSRFISKVDSALGNPDPLEIVDIGAGSGELLTNVLKTLPAALLRRVRPVAVEIPVIRDLYAGHADDTPRELPDHADLGWRSDIPDGIVGVLLATEWLDNVPLDLAENGCYLYDGEPVSAQDAEWISRWWPSPSGIVEIGRSRDEAWASAVGKLRAGVALTVDYGHLASTRPSLPTVTGFRDGREVEPLLDGSTDITCHVAMDSVAAAAGIRYTLKRQREALQELGVSGARPPLELAHKDPVGYVRALAEASEAATLTDPDGLGGHWWLWHELGCAI
ncbi:MAG TPA: hypothetical protein DGG94_01300 [Micromonosporaceae bacterium]|nr:hypothetical protein [Micromonosporaceae bacterium]